jgi:hypothetical protein
MAFITIQPHTIINTDLIGQIRYLKDSRTTTPMKDDCGHKIPAGEPITKSTSHLVIHGLGEKMEFRSDEADEVHQKLMEHIQVVP